MTTTAIFDFDGTLASTLECIHLCMRESLAIFSYPEPSLAEVRKTVGLTLEESVRRLTNFQCEESIISALVMAYRTLHNIKAQSLVRLFDGAVETLDMLQSLGIQCILVSNKGRSGLHRLLEHLMIKDYFDVILSAEDSEYRKPDARLYSDNIAPFLLSKTPGGVLVVGDTESDLLFATQAGLKSCWARYGYGDAEKCLALKPDFIISDIKDLRGLVRA